MLKIENIRTRTVSIPLPRRLISSIHDIDRVGCVLVWIETSGNVTGEGLLFTLNDLHLGLMQQAVQSLASKLIGKDAEEYERLWLQLWRDVQFFGTGGLLTFAISALDMAVWDAVGKHHRRPIATLLGSSRSRVPVYASGGLFLNQSVDELVADSASYRSAGYRAVKMRVGLPCIDEDVARVRAVRHALGDNVALMADANQALNFNHALALGRRLQEFGLRWFEEPIPAWQFDAYEALTAALDLPIATGESNYTRVDFRRLLQRRCADVIMPDLSRIGGFTELRKVAAMAEIMDIEVSPHLYPEYTVGFLGGTAEGGMIEDMPWFAPLFVESLEMDEGALTTPQRPGIGFNFDPAAVNRYAVSETVQVLEVAP